ncbi:glucuronoxylan 4-O-methyltransferase 1-like [Typha angustifolia]|uniref:glucuronoxylan 4-O-methyltransferase 1-like n=1 Tax=Typha angustifolia TaxID=59011 RepID=UPI003C2D5F98
MHSRKASKLLAMKAKMQSFLNLKLFLLGFFLLFTVLFVLRPSLQPSSSPQGSRPVSSKAFASTPACTKIPQSLANTVIHYTTSNITPQQTFKEIAVTARVLEKRSPCNFLVFGLGHDSLMWTALNHGGRTIFLEEDEAWIKSIREKQPSLEAYHVKYSTKVRDADDLLMLGRLPECMAVGDTRFSTCQLALKELPSVFYEVDWDVIMVDAPTGYFLDAPGRMAAIYTAGMAARGRREGEVTDVFVHDVNRVVEDKFSMAFLCEGYLKEQEGRLRHFAIPSHRAANEEKPFCPLMQE